MGDIADTGAIDWLLVAAPDKTITGELVPPLLDLVDRRLIRILDALLIVYENLWSLPLPRRRPQGRRPADRPRPHPDPRRRSTPGQPRGAPRSVRLLPSAGAQRGRRAAT
jgi:hypothetical protein